MPRPRLRRHICVQPDVTYFKPRGIPLRALRVIQISREELETLWLVDVKGFEQKLAARHMRTSQSTIQRILTQARKKVAQAIVAGKAISINN